MLPEECCALYDHVKAGRHHEALELQRKLTPLAQLVTTVHGVAGLKVALELAGYHGGAGAGAAAGRDEPNPRRHRGSVCGVRNNANAGSRNVKSRSDEIVTGVQT